MNVPVIIPTYNPSERILEVIDGLLSAGFGQIIVIDDGSRPECGQIFAKISENRRCVLLSHEKNFGKGHGLKTGFKYVLENIGDCDGVVTADDDGQHTPADIFRVAQKMLETGVTVLGARDFSGGDGGKIPLKSRFGNGLTRFVFRFLCGISITDTQTGLRAIPMNCLGQIAEISGEGFEYETNMLLEMKRLSLGFAEEPISTIYRAGNSSTHFNPLTDSIKIYSVIIKFTLSSAACSLIDIGLFTLLNLGLVRPFAGNENARIFAATLGARAVSSLANYLLNRRGVFRSEKSVKKSAVRYYILCAAQFAVSFMLVSALTAFFGTEKSLWQTVIKAAADTLLFFAGFGIQRDWVYK